MRTVLAIAAILLLTGCGADDGPRGAVQAPTPVADELPGSAPAAPGLVTTRWPVTVLDDGDRAELCAGGVEDSLPPRCSGPVLVGWEWSEHAGDFRSANGVRWGEFVVTGRFDGRELTPTEVTPLSLFDPPPTDIELDPELDAKNDSLHSAVTEKELQRIQRELVDLPGMLSSRGADGAVAITVVYDDGSLQRWADRTYGDGVVAVSSALADLGG